MLTLHDHQNRWHGRCRGEREVCNRKRAYSPEYRYWNIVNGELSYAGDEAFENAMERYGNLRVPKWAITAGGLVRYEMVSLTGSNQPPDPALFVPPPEFRE